MGSGKPVVSFLYCARQHWRAIAGAANGRNVVAIGASTKSSSPEIWIVVGGPTELGTYGIFALAPGVSISSAKADGIDDSMNDALRASSGTSMATPIAASYAGIIQQMVEQGGLCQPMSR